MNLCWSDERQAVVAKEGWRGVLAASYAAVGEQGRVAKYSCLGIRGGGKLTASCGMWVGVLIVSV